MFYSPLVLFNPSTAASESKVAEVDTSDDEELASGSEESEEDSKESAEEIENTAPVITGLEFHSIMVRNRGRVPVLLSQPPNSRLYYRTKSGNKAFCTPLQLQTFAVITADDLDVEGTNPILLLNVLPNGYVHKVHQCWCNAYMS